MPQNRARGCTVVPQQHCRRHGEIDDHISNPKLVEPPQQILASACKGECKRLNGQQQQTRCVEQGNQPRMPTNTQVLLRKLEHEVQQQYGLQHVRENIAPVNRPVKRVQLSAEMEGVKYERNQAKNVEVRRSRGGPSPTKH